MNKLTKISAALLSTGLAFSMLSGCGGGGSSSSTTTAPTGADAEITSSVAETLAVNAAQALPGCSFSSETTVTPSSSVVTMYLATAKVMIDDRAAAASVNSATVRATTIDESSAGNCPIADPGTFTVTGSHDDGVDDVTYTFTNYCLGDDVDNVTVNGTADVKAVGVPSDAGPIPQYTTVSTGTGGITVVEKSTEGTFTHSAILDDYKYTYGNGDDGATLASPSTLTADTLSIVDGRSDGTFSVSGVNVGTYYNDASEVVLDIENISYTDPDSGVVNVSSSPIVINDSGVLISGTITVSGTNGSEMTMTLSDAVENGFNVLYDGGTVGVMDCSGLSSGGLL